MKRFFCILKKHFSRLDWLDIVLFKPFNLHTKMHTLENSIDPDNLSNQDLQAQQAHNFETTSILRHTDVTSTLCVRWEVCHYDV